LNYIEVSNELYVYIAVTNSVAVAAGGDITLSSFTC